MEATPRPSSRRPLQRRVGEAGVPLASGSLASPRSSAWNDVSLSSAAVTAGTKYWIAILGTGGALVYRDTDNGATSYDGSGNLTKMPASYPSRRTWAAGPASAYVNGVTNGSPPPPPPPPPPPAPVAPSNTGRPTISGTPQQGDTLTASQGTWSGDTPMTYSYKWSDGATGQTDTLGASDVGHTVSVTVTAQNDGGSSSATSAAVGPVSGPAGGGGSGGGGTTPNPGMGSRADPSFFPIGVWLQTPENTVPSGGYTDCAAGITIAKCFANIGVNTFVGQSDGGNNSANLAALKNAGEIGIEPRIPPASATRTTRSSRRGRVSLTSRITPIRRHATASARSYPSTTR